MPFDGAAILFEEAARLGIRFVLCRGGATQTRTPEQALPAALRPERFDSWMADVERLVARYHQPAHDAMRRIVMAPTTPLYSLSPGELRESARSHGASAYACTAISAKRWPISTRRRTGSP